MEQKITAAYVPVNLLAPSSWKVMVGLAAAKHGVHQRDIISGNQAWHIARARHEAIYLIASHTEYSVAKIGSLMSRDPATVKWALKKFPKLVRKSRVHANTRFKKGENE